MFSSLSWLFCIASPRKVRVGEGADASTRGACAPRRFALAALGFFLIAGGAQVAADIVLSGTSQRRAGNPETVIVPYDATKPLDAQKLDQLYVPYEHFIELWNAAKENRRAKPRENPGTIFTRASSRYDARLDGNSLHVTGALQIVTFRDEWVSVPMPFDGARIGSLKLDGKSAALVEKNIQPAVPPQGKNAAKQIKPAPPRVERAILIEKPGRHLVEVELEVPLARDKSGASWTIPASVGTLVQLVLPRADMRATIAPGAGVIERVEDGKKIVVAALGETDKIEVKLGTSLALAVAKKPALARIDANLDVTPAFETVRAKIEFSFPESRQDQFTVFLDKNLTLLDLAIPNLKSWKLDATANPQRLDVVLSEPARDQLEFAFTAERAVSASEKNRAFPFFSAEANRVERVSTLNADASVAITPKPAAAFRRIPPAGKVEPGFTPVAAFSNIGGENLAYEVGTKTVRRSAEIHAVYQVNHTKIELVAAMTLDSKDALFGVTLAVPADFTVQAVESERLRDWWREGDALRVRFRGVAPGQTHLVLHLVKQFAKAPAELAITPLALADFSEVNGDAVIAADKGVKVTMTALTDAKETDAAKVAKDFDIVAPLERKRGLVFKNQTFSAKVALASQPARLSGAWILFAQAHESWISVSTQAHIEARQASVGAVSFTLPASVPEARVTGENVRETSSYLDGDVRRYWVFFRVDVYDLTNFTIDFDLPHTGSARLPDLQFPDLERVEGFVIAQNSPDSDYEMQVNANGLDKATRADLPFLPPLAQDAQLFRAHPGWSVEIKTTALEKEAGRAAFVAWAEMTTALRDDGGEWHRAVYHLQNRSLQFLPVKLPAGAELTTVRVAGEAVRADKGKVKGVEVVLVPLIKTKAGDLAYDVELVYRAKSRGVFGFFTKKKLDAPELVGITVERTFWNVWLSEKERLVRAEGNMEEVIEEVAQAEKLEGSVLELKSLAKTIASNRGNSEVYENATRNYDDLSSRVKSENSLQLGSRRGATAEKPAQVAKGKDMQQRAYVSQKQQEFKQELDQQAMQVDDVRKSQLPAPANGPGQAAADIPPQSGKQPTAAFDANGGYVGGIQVQSKRAQAVQQGAGNKLFINDNVAWNGKVDVTLNGGTTMPQGQMQQAAQQVQALKELSNNLEGLRQNDAESSAVNASAALDFQKKAGEVQAEQNLNFIQSNRSQIAPSEPASPNAASQLNIIDAGNNTKALNLARGNTYTGNTTVTGGTLNFNGNHVVGGDTTIISGGIIANGTLTKSGAGTSTLGGMETYAPAKPQPGSSLTLPTNMAGVGGGGGIFGGELSGRGGVINESKPAVKKPALRAEGRVSLAVDFPTEGRVHHFKKLKADARLQLDLVRPEKGARVAWLAVFLGLAMMLRYTARQYSKYVTRRRVGVAPAF